MSAVLDFEWMMSSLRLALPLLLAAMGGVVCERSGIVNIALEGLMIAGALCGAIAVYATGSQPAGLFAAACAGALAAAVYAIFAIHGRAQQVVAGAAFNMLAAGGAPYVTKALYGISGGTPSGVEFSGETLSGADGSGVNLLLVITVVALVLPFAINWFLGKTRGGLLLRFAGEEPRALESAGINPDRVRFLAVVASGVLAGLGGATLSVLLSSSYARGMTGGRGFMALAAVIFAGWRPVPAAITCLAFAGADAAQIRLQGGGHELFGVEVPVQFIQAMPYLITLLAVALRSGSASGSTSGSASGSSGAPRFLGRST